MATFELTGPDGATYHLDAPDERAALSAFATFTGAKKAPEKADPVTVNDVGRSFATGVPIVGGLLNKADAATNATLAPYIEPFLSPSKNDISRNGETWKERYAKSLDMQNQGDEKFAEQHPIVDTGAKLAGGMAAMAPAVAAAPAIMGATGSTAQQLVMGALSNGVIGGADAAVRGGDPISGAVVGAALPVALGLGGRAVNAAAAPIFANIRARVNPEGYATSQVARAVSESGQTPEQLGRMVEDANAAGQPFTLADALGNPGQRMLSTVTRAPGEGRTEAVRFLNERQAGQGERVGNIVDEGLGTGPTARQTIDQLTEQARRESAPLYREALDQQPVWNNRMQQFFNHPVTAKGLREGVDVQMMESLASGHHFDPLDYAITNFNEAGDPIISGVPNMRTINLIKKGWDQMLEKYRDPTTGRLALDEQGRALDQVRRSFLNEVDSLNPTYGRARAAYAGPAQVREAVGVGSDAAARGRAADNVARFDAMTEPTKQGFRAGYADARNAKIESTPGLGSNKVQPLTSQKAQQELDALSLHQGPTQPGRLAPMQQRLANEQTMFETRHQAMGNSKTSENFADDAAMAVDPHLVKNIITGNWHGALGNVMTAGHTAMTGNTPAVRAAVGRMLLDRGVNPANLQAAIGETVARIRFIQGLTRNLGRGAAGAIPATLPMQSAN